MNEKMALGVYAHENTPSKATFGIIDDKGNVIAKIPSIPLITAISGSYYRSFLSKSPYARVWKILVRKHKKTDKEKALVKFWVKNKDGEKISEKPIEFNIYRNGEENGYYIFQTLTKNEGKPILFTKRPQDAGNFDEAIVIHMNSVSDYFYYEAQ